MAHAIKLETEKSETPSSAQEDGVPAIAVIWRNGKDTPRGAWFPADSRDAAIAGAAEMGMHAIKAETPEIQKLALKLPKGRVFESGKLFAPLIQTKVFENLMANLPNHGIKAKPRLVMGTPSAGGDGDADAEDPGASVPEGTRPTDWSQITVGSLVLAEEARMEGWFEAIVIEVCPKDVFKLKWRDYDDPNITRHVSRLALMMQIESVKTA